MNRRKFISLTVGTIAYFATTRLAWAVDAVKTTLLKQKKVITTGSSPKSVEFTPDGKLAYINNLEDMIVWVMDTSTYEIVKTIRYSKTPTVVKLGKKSYKSYEEKPVETCFTHSGARVWRSLHNASGVTVENVDGTELKLPFESGRKKVTIKDKLNGTTVKSSISFIKTSKTPKILKSTPDGSRVCVANWHGPNVTVLDAETGENFGNIKTGWLPRGIAFTSDSKTGFVCDFGSNNITYFDVKAVKKLGVMKSVGNRPRHILMAPDNTMYVGFHGDGYIRRFDTVTKELLGELYVGGQIRTITVTPDFNYIFADSFNKNKVFVIDVAELKVVEEVKSSHHPVGAAFNHKERELWVVNQGNAKLRIFDFAG